MKNNHKKLKVITVLSFLIIAIVLIALSLMVEEAEKQPSSILKIIVHILSHLGVGFFVLAVISVLFDTDHWMDYFRLRLTEIVTKRSYLESYSLEQLLELQEIVMTSYFKDSKLDSQLLFQYQKNIRNNIELPFRYNFEEDLLVKFKDDTKTKLTLHRELSWSTKSSGNKLQNLISWIPEKGEFEDVNIISLKLKHESFKKETGKEEVFIDYKDFKESWKRENNGLVIPIEDYSKLDGLKITIVFSLVIQIHQLFALKMAIPTKGLAVTIRMPEDLKIRVENFILDDYNYSVTDQVGFYKLSSMNWIMSNEGLTFQFFP